VHHGKRTQLSHAIARASALPWVQETSACDAMRGLERADLSCSEALAQVERACYTAQFNVVLNMRGAIVYTFWSAALTACLVTVPLMPARAGDLYIHGRLNGHSTTITLNNYEKHHGQYSISGLECVLQKDGLTEEAVFSAVGDWQSTGSVILLADAGRITRSADDGDLTFKWISPELHVEHARGPFKGTSPSKLDTTVELDPGCDDSTEEPGSVAVLLKPGAEPAARRYFRTQGWKTYKDGVVARGGEGENAFKVEVPFGSERNAMERIKQTGLVFDVGRNFFPKTTPGVGSVLLTHDRFSSENINELQADVEELLRKTWPGEKREIHVKPQNGTAFDLTLYGPVLRYTELPKLPGHWISTKLQVIVDHVVKGNRLLIDVRDARLIRWPEMGRGEPPRGYGTKIECEEGDSPGVQALIAIVSAPINKASKLYGGRDYSPPVCE